MYSNTNKLIQLTENDGLLLREAAKLGRTDILSNLIANYPLIGLFDWNMQDANGLTALMIATQKNHISFVCALLPNLDSDNLNLKSNEGYTALDYAILKGHLEITKALILKQDAIFLYSTDRYGQTILHWAAKQGYIDIIEACISRAIDYDIEKIMNSEGNEGSTPIALAAQNGHMNVVHSLIKNYPFNEKKLVDHALIYLAKNGFTEAAKSLISIFSEIELTAKNKHGQTALILPAKNGHIGTVTLLLQTCLKNIDEQDNKGMTALMHAASNGYIAIVQILIGKKADFKIEDKKYATALTHALNSKSGEVAHIILPIHIAALEHEKRTRVVNDAMILAIKNRLYSVIKELFSNGANEHLNEITRDLALREAIRNDDIESLKMIMPFINLTMLTSLDVFERTPIIYAAENGSSKALKYIIYCFRRAGVLPNLFEQNKNGLNALMVACRSGHLKIVKSLMPYTDVARLSCVDSLGKSALVHAIQSDDMAITKVLVLRLSEIGDVTILSSAFKYAIRKNNVRMVNLLLPHLDLAALNQEEPDGATAFELVCDLNSEIIADALISRYLEIGPLALNNRDRRGNTPLILSAGYGCLGILNKILQHLETNELNLTNEYGHTALMMAVSFNHINVVIRLIEMMDTTQINYRDTLGCTALMYACKNGHSKLVSFLINQIAMLDPSALSVADNSGETALLKALYTGKVEVIKALLPHLSLEMLQVSDNFGNTALMSAIQLHSIEIVNLIISKFVEYGALESLSSPMSNGETPLIYIISSFDEEENLSEEKLAIVKALIPYYDLAALNQESPDGYTAFMLACEASNLAVFDVLISRLLKLDPIALNHQNSHGVTSLMVLAEAGDADLFEILSSYLDIAALSAVDHRGSTALHYASTFNHTSIIMMLLERLNIEHVNRVDSLGKTALMHACQQEHYEASKCLIDYIVEKDPRSLDLKDHNGETALMHAIKQGYSEIVDIFVCVDSVNLFTLHSTNSSGLTAMMLAAFNDDYQTVKALYDFFDFKKMDLNNQAACFAVMFAAAMLNKIDVLKDLPILNDESLLSITTYSGKTLLMLAAKYDAVEVFNYLLNKKPDLNARDGNEYTALILAAKNDSSGIIESLVPMLNISELNAANNSGKTALMYLAKTNNFNAVELLLSRGADLNLKDNKNETAIMKAFKEEEKDMTYRLFISLKQRAGVSYEAMLQVEPSLDVIHRDFITEILKIRKWAFEVLWIFNKTPGVQHDAINLILSANYPKWFKPLTESTFNMLLLELEKKLYEKKTKRKKEHSFFEVEPKVCVLFRAKRKQRKYKTPMIDTSRVNIQRVFKTERQ